MEREIKAKFLKGMIKPLEKLDMEEGKEITVRIEEAPPKTTRTVESLKNSFGSWKGLIDTEKLKKDIYKDRLISTRPQPKL